MVIDLTPYRTEAPYPEVHKFVPDKNLLDRLMSGYSGRVSELTTVLQYDYHSTRFHRRFRAISEAVRGIFYVETMHMDFLGECICKLGGTAHYTLASGQEAEYWNASLIDYGDMPAKMLLMDIENEKYAAEYYEQTASKCEQPDIKNLLLRLAQDEKLHIEIFKDLYRRFS